MSDIFRLLSRSTKLQKHAVTPSQDSKLIPSASASVRPQILGGLDAQPKSQETDKRSKKRKRQVTQLGAETIERELDFFAGRNPREPEGPPAAESPTDHGDASDAESDADDTATIPLPLEERKRILKLHKLKVTVMDHFDPKKSSRDSKREKSLKKQVKLRPSAFPEPLISIQELRSKFGISKRLAENLDLQGYRVPTEVQLGCLPMLLGNTTEVVLQNSSQPRVLNGSQIDLLTVAPTGSGKTLAFLIPVVQGLLNNKHDDTSSMDAKTLKPFVKALIIAPTHELVNQIVNETKKLTLGTGVKVTAMSKGMHIAQESSTDEESAHPTIVKSDILVSTPLTLLNSMAGGPSAPGTLASLQFLVLDEADVLLDPLFRDQTLRIWDSCTNPKLQTSLWSATIGSSIETLAQEKIAQRKATLQLDSGSRSVIRLIAGLKDSALPTVSHKLIYAASEQGKLLAIRQILHPSTSVDTGIAVLRPPFIVFAQTIPRATALHAELLYDIPTEAGGSGRIAVLHSGLSDSSRSDIMTGFRQGNIWVIITTDLLSRGVDFRGVNGIINYDIPTTAAAYVHRAGRTGRAGRSGGMAVTLYTKEDIPYVKNIANVIAASERVMGKPRTESSIQQWLLDALPDLSKNTKQELKKKGVESRRTAVGDGASKGSAKRSTISTKSGYDKRRERKRREAFVAARAATDNKESSTSEGEWEGLD